MRRMSAAAVWIAWIYWPVFAWGQAAEWRLRPALFNWSMAEEASDIDRETIVTDRPDFTEASSTVGLGVSQIEFGYTYLRDRDGNTRVRQHSWGEPLLRIGVWADWLEFRAAAFPTTRSTTQGGTPMRLTGWDDLYLGLKIGMTPQAGWLPEMSLIPQMTVPTGGSALTSDRTLAGVNWCYAWDVTDRWAIGASTQVNRASDEMGGTHAEWAQSVTLVRSWTDQLANYTEWYGIFPDGASNAPTQYYFNGGLTYLVTPDVQWDVPAGVGLSEAADDSYVGTGFSLRFR